ncbi:MAG: ATP-binding protein [Coriobacteriia bacterium]|nr:ATP-binding protein [Coriobacteriia bacterium]
MGSELSVLATVENIETVTDFVNAQLEANQCPAKTIAHIDVAIDELFGNIARYAYHPEEGPATVRAEVLDGENQGSLQVIITFTDQGVPYNPLTGEDPDIALSAEEREVGGLGVFLSKQLMDDLSYEFRDGSNILTVKKSW